MSEVDFGETLRVAMMRQGITQEALAGSVGVSRATVGDWMRGGVEPRPRHVFALEEALELPPGHLSHHLGYLPAGTAEASDPDPADLIRSFPDLSPESKDALTDVYRALARADAQRAAITARSRRGGGGAEERPRSA